MDKLISILIPAALIGAMGLTFGALIAITGRIFAVKKDPIKEAVREILPGANCGGCGFAGCSSYAEAVLNGEASIDKCASGGNECARAMGQIMGVKVADMQRKVALVRCSGYRRVDADGKRQGVKMKGIYEGFHDCLAASKAGGSGPLSCKYGCLGYGTCTKACKYGAISVKNGVAVVDEDLCVGCMACAQVCPRKLIIPVKPNRNVVIACNSLSKGATTNRACSVGCIGCGKCVKTCPNGAITVSSNHAVIDYSKCDSCGKCAEVCPKGLIKNSKVETLGEPKPVITPTFE